MSHAVFREPFVEEQSFDRFEQRMDNLEAHVESYDLGSKKDLKQEFSDLESADVVEEELRDLKSKRADQKRPPQERK